MRRLSSQEKWKAGSDVIKVTKRHYKKVRRRKRAKEVLTGAVS